MNKPLFQRLTLIGLGLIGSSIARAARARGLVGEIHGCAKTKATRQVALELGLVDQVFASPAAAVRDADLVIVCAPLGVYGAIGKAIGPRLQSGAIVSDVGSCKQSVLRDLGPHLPQDAHFVPGHPVAGTEQSGPRAGFAELFAGRWCILTPPPGTSEPAIAKLREFWTRIGAKVEIMEAQHHDLVLAITSHVPHLIAYNIVGTADDLGAVTKSEVIKYSAGGFRDFTRIAASDPTMWRDVFLNNREAVLEMLGRFSEDLTALQRAIRWGDGAALYDLFVRTRAIRRAIVAAGQDVNAANFGRQPAVAAPPRAAVGAKPRPGRRIAGRPAR